MLKFLEVFLTSC